MMIIQGVDVDKPGDGLVSFGPFATLHCEGDTIIEGSNLRHLFYYDPALNVWIKTGPDKLCKFSDLMITSLKD